MKLAIVSLALFLIGCASSPMTVVPKRVRLGMEPEQVRDHLGKPHKRFLTPAGEIWIYRGGKRVLYFDPDNTLAWADSR